MKEVYLFSNTKERELFKMKKQKFGPAYRDEEIKDLRVDCWGSVLFTVVRLPGFKGLECMIPHSRDRLIEYFERGAVVTPLSAHQVVRLNKKITELIKAHDGRKETYLT